MPWFGSTSESRIDKWVARVVPGSHLSGTAGTETGHGVRKALAHTPPSTGESGRVTGEFLQQSHPHGRG